MKHLALLLSIVTVMLVLYTDSYSIHFQPFTFATMHSTATGRVLTGLDVLIEDRYDVLEGRRVGLITNQSAVTYRGAHILNYFQKRNRYFDLIAIFTPEHGLHGNVEQLIEDRQDYRLGVPIYSLYDDTREPQREELMNIDTLVFDIQDIGARYYTYIATMAYAMKVASYHNLPFVVLDRPNPINGVDVEGAIPFDEDPRLFTSVYPIPTRHGMTVGELAKLFNDHFEIYCNLYVVKMENWDRHMYYNETRLPWRNPSPNIRNLDAAILYTGLGILESTNMSVGRGTQTPFFLYGAPWMDKEKVTEKLQSLNLPGLQFRSARFKPTASTYAGEWCEGFRVRLVDRDAYNSQETILKAIYAIHELYGDQFSYEGSAPMLGDYGIEDYIHTNKPVEEVLETWNARIEQFKSIREQYLLY